LSRSPHPSQGLRLGRDGAKALEAIGAAASMKAKCECDSGDCEVVRQRGFIGHSSASAVPNVCLCDRRTFALVLFLRHVRRQPTRENCAAKTILRGDITSITFKNRPRDRKAKTGSLWLCRYERIEHAFRFVARNTISRVRYFHLKVWPGVLARSDRQGVRRWLVLHRVHARLSPGS
jgi:hypothetical protein